MKKMFMGILLILMISNCSAEDSLLKDKNDFDIIQKVNMNNIGKKLDYLIHKLVCGKKYSFKENRQFIEYIIIGRWASPPHVGYEFKKNNVYKKNLYSISETISGNWRINSDGLELKTNGKWEKNIIKFFNLKKDEETNYYYFNIIFDKPLRLLSIDTGLIEIWESDSPMENK